MSCRLLLTVTLLCAACGPSGRADRQNAAQSVTDAGPKDAKPSADASSPNAGAKPDGAPPGADVSASPDLAGQTGVDVAFGPDVAVQTDTAPVPMDTAPVPMDTAPAVPKNAKVAFVVFDPNGLAQGDQAMQQRLIGKGHTVTWVDDDAAAVSDADYDLVVVSWSSLAAAVNSKYKNSTRPVMITDPVVFDDMGMTGTVQETDFFWSLGKSVSISMAAHPLAAGLTGSVEISSADDNIGWGVPGGGGKTIATVGGKAALFAYEKGDALKSGTAAGRRIGFFASETLARTLTADGWKLFDAAIDWALRP